jgi:hypothetical protein
VAYYWTRAVASPDTASNGLSKSARKRNNKKKADSPVSGDGSADTNNLYDANAEPGEIELFHGHTENPERNLPVRPPTEDWFMALAEQMSLRPDLALGAPPGIPAPSWANEMEYQDGYRDPMTSQPRSESDSLAAAMEAFELDEDEEYSSPYQSTYTDSLVPEDSMSNVGRAPRNSGEDACGTDVGATAEPADDDGWGGAPIYTYDTEKPLNWRRPGQPTDCPEHGIRCPKGMCRYQAQKKASERRRQEEAERIAQRKEQREKMMKRNERKNGVIYHYVLILHTINIQL